MLAMVAAQLGSGRIIARTGRYRMYPILGGALMTAGALALLLLDVDTPVAVASGLTVVVGAGMGLLMQATLLVTMYGAEPRDMGAASGTVTLVRTLGGSLGVAVLGAVFTARLDGADTRLTPAQALRLPEPAREGLAAAVTSGVHGVLLGTALVAALAFAVAWLVRDTALDPGTGSASRAAPGSADRPPADRPLPRPS
ncbi:hypothetical protein ACFVVP_02965 [Streptomyces sp. NPDC058128]|uniref:hypothetical protein n=1 Tax=Streptomyces sp. NPDC058128 TaxID=3346352 RepID=UPI0036EC1FD1